MFQTIAFMHCLCKGIGKCEQIERDGIIERAIDREFLELVTRGGSRR
jgi:hypothetical protein